jgi:SRSO17 transposase
MESKRTTANIARQTGMDEQETQHVMSDAPWAGPGLIRAVQPAVQQHPAFEHGAMWVIDESADAQAGGPSAGASRQHTGRLGKVDLSQVGVFASLVTPRMNRWLDGELVFPASWCAAEHAATRQNVGVPTERAFNTKPALAGDLLERIQAKAVGFEAVAMADLEGRKTQRRRRLADQHLEDEADVPATTVV